MYKALQVLFLLGLSIALVGLCGCPSDDDDSADDDAGDDDASDDDGADDDGGDDDTVEPSEINGLVDLSYSESPDGNGGVNPAGRFYATFPTLATAASGVDLAMPAGSEQCALTTYTQSELENTTPAVYTYESAGTLTFAGPSGDQLMNPTDGANGLIFYQLLLNPGTQLQFDTISGVSADGDEFGAFDAPEALVMPEEIELTSPTVGPSFNVNGDLTVTWTGGNTDTVMLFLATADPGNDYGYLACEADNDGSFTLPGADIGQMPSGPASLTLVQSLSHYQEVDGRWVAFTGSCSLTAAGEKP